MMFRKYMGTGVTPERLGHQRRRQRDEAEAVVVVQEKVADEDAPPEVDPAHRVVLPADGDHLVRRLKYLFINLVLHPPCPGAVQVEIELLLGVLPIDERATERGEEGRVAVAAAQQDSLVAVELEAGGRADPLKRRRPVLGAGLVDEIAVVLSVQVLALGADGDAEQGEIVLGAEDLGESPNAEGSRPGQRTVKQETRGGVAAQKVTRMRLPLLLLLRPSAVVALVRSLR
jgi:hypothetical protein